MNLRKAVWLGVGRAQQNNEMTAKAVTFVFNAFKSLIGWLVGIIAVCEAGVELGRVAAIAMFVAIILAQWWDTHRSIVPPLKAWVSYLATCPIPLKISIFFCFWGFGSYLIPALVLVGLALWVRPVEPQRLSAPA